MMKTILEKSSLSSVTPEKPPLQPMTQEQRQKMVEALDRWANEGNEEEQKESFEILKKALGEERTISNRNLFP
jgi:hypothetical protein